MVVKYISSAADGTGDWIADGSGDQAVINTALAWASNNPGNEIHLKGPFSYDILSTVKFGSNTIFSGDSTAILRLNNSCAWDSMVPVLSQLGGTGTLTTNVEICGFQINCNESHLYGTGGRIHGKGYYNALYIQGQNAHHASNISIHDMQIYDSMGDGLRFGYCTGIDIQKCIMWNLQHCSTFCVDCSDITIAYNDIQAITCSGTRFDNSQNWIVHNNNIRDWTGVTNAPKSGEYGVQFGNQPAGTHTTLTQNGEVYDNTINVGGCGIQIEDYLKTAGVTPQTVNIHNNAISGGKSYSNGAYFAGVSIYSWGNGLTIQKNTISGSTRAGILGYGAIVSGVTVEVKDNNIINTKKAGSEGGHGIWNKVPTKMTIIAENNYLYGNITGKYLGVPPLSESSSTITDAVPGGSPVTPPDPEPDTPVLPVANFTADVISGYTPLTVRFTNLSQNATEWYWEFGGGSTSSENSPMCTYLTAGVYTVKLTASNANGTDSKLVTITAYDADSPVPPVDPEPDTPYTGYQGLAMPSGDGHYIFRLLSIPAVGDSVLLFPMPSGEYALLKLIGNATMGSQLIVVPDGKGNYFAIK
jgi:PKD repeat protein